MSESPDTASTNQTAAQLIDALLDGGEAVDEGVFTLDPAAAAAKMQAFAYHERSPYLIPIVEALHGLGAREVTLTRLGEDLEVRGLGVARHGARQGHEGNDPELDVVRVCVGYRNIRRHGARFMSEVE